MIAMLGRFYCFCDAMGLWCNVIIYEYFIMMMLIVPTHRPANQNIITRFWSWSLNMNMLSNSNGHCLTLSRARQVNTE